jgi:hypothetical protein
VTSNEYLVILQQKTLDKEVVEHIKEHKRKEKKRKKARKIVKSFNLVE